LQLNIGLLHVEIRECRGVILKTRSELGESRREMCREVKRETEKNVEKIHCAGGFERKSKRPKNRKEGHQGMSGSKLIWGVQKACGGTKIVLNRTGTEVEKRSAQCHWRADWGKTSTAKGDIGSGFDIKKKKERKERLSRAGLNLTETTWCRCTLKNPGLSGITSLLTRGG